MKTIKLLALMAILGTGLAARGGAKKGAEEPKKEWSGDNPCNPCGGGDNPCGG